MRFISPLGRFPEDFLRERTPCTGVLYSSPFHSLSLYPLHLSLSPYLSPSLLISLFSLSFSLAYLLDVFVLVTMYLTSFLFNLKKICTGYMYSYFSGLSSWIKCWEMLLHSCVNLVIIFTSWHIHIHLLSTFGSFKCHPRMKRAQLVGYGTLKPKWKALVPYFQNILILNISSYISILRPLNTKFFPNFKIVLKLDQLIPQFNFTILNSKNEGSLPYHLHYMYIKFFTYQSLYL